MQVLHILHQSLPHVCGYSIRSGHIVSLQKAMGIEASAVTSIQQPAQINDQSVDGIRYFRTPTRKLRGSPFREVQMMTALHRRVAEVIDITAPDIVHAHSPILVGIPAYLATRRRKIPFVYEIRDLWENAVADHGRFRHDSLPYVIARSMEGWLINRSDAVVTICESLRENLEARTRQSVHVVANGVDPEVFQPAIAQQSWIAEWNPKGRAVIAYVGAFQPYEGLNVLVDAMDEILRSKQDVQLIIAGDGPERGHIEEMVKRRKVQDHVTLPGRIAHHRVAEVYAVADLMVYPRISTRTTQLTTPLKTLEALAMRKAVLASDLKPIRELITDGQTGQLFNAGDGSDLAMHAIKLLNDPIEREKLGAAGRRWVEKYKRWDDSVRVYQKIYADLLSARK